MKIGKIKFDKNIISASGCWVESEEQLLELDKNSLLGGIVSKTCTLNKKDPNPIPNYYEKDGIIFNCMGLPNRGYEYYKNLTNKFDKPYILSLAVDTNTNNVNPNNFNSLLCLLNDYDEFVEEKKLVEINVSCPNINDMVIGYHKKELKNLLDKIFSLKLKNIYVGLKLPPFLELYKIKKISELLNSYKIKFITCSNSIPGAYIPELNKRMAMSGGFNKYISLANVKYFHEYLNKNIKIIGCGGIKNKEDVEEYLSCGASLVQVGSYFYNKEKNKLELNFL